MNDIESWKDLGHKMTPDLNWDISALNSSNELKNKIFKVNAN